ncbi:unnamed protein product [Arctogadus glacialis]
MWILKTRREYKLVASSRLERSDAERVGCVQVLQTDSLSHHRPCAEADAGTTDHRPEREVRRTEDGSFRAARRKRNWREERKLKTSRVLSVQIQSRRGRSGPEEKEKGKRRT